MFQKTQRQRSAHLASEIPSVPLEFRSNEERLLTEHMEAEREEAENAARAMTDVRRDVKKKTGFDTYKAYLKFSGKSLPKQYEIQEFLSSPLDEYAYIIDILKENGSEVTVHRNEQCLLPSQAYWNLCGPRNGVSIKAVLWSIDTFLQTPLGSMDIFGLGLYLNLGSSTAWGLALNLTMHGSGRWRFSRRTPCLP